MPRTLPARIPHDQQRQIVIDRSAGRTSIGGEGNVADAPIQLCRLLIGECRQRDLFELIEKLARVAADVLLMFGWDRQAKERLVGAGQHRRGMRMRRRDREALARRGRLFC